MRYLAAVLLVCLLVTGTVSALPANISAVKAAKTVTPIPSETPWNGMPGGITAQPTTRIPVSSVKEATALTDTNTFITVYLDSVPPGAAVKIDGGRASGTTPAKLAFLAGTHTVVLSMPQYEDYTIPLDLTAGMPTQYITANLVKFNAGSTAAVSGKPAGAPGSMMTLAAGLSPMPGVVVTPTPADPCTQLPPPTTLGAGWTWRCMLLTDAYETYQRPFYSWWSCGYATVNNQFVTEYCFTGEPKGSPQSVGINVSSSVLGGSGITMITGDPDPLLLQESAAEQASCPNAGWSCLTPAAAVQQFGSTNARYGDLPCAFTQEGNQTVAEYCYQDVTLDGMLSTGAIGAGGIQNGADIYLMNDTGELHAVVNAPPALRPAGAAPESPLQPLIDFFSNIFGTSSKPPSKLDIVGFNPQPEPPGWGHPGRLK
jgi:hypothetical protein